MGIVYQTSKNGIKYAYENEAYWDKEKQQSRSRRKLVGRVDPETGEIVPTRSYKKKAKEQEVSKKPGPAPITEYRRCFTAPAISLTRSAR